MLTATDCRLFHDSGESSTAPIGAQTERPDPFVGNEHSAFVVRPHCSTRNVLELLLPRLVSTVTDIRTGLLAAPPSGWCADYVVLSALAPTPCATRVLTVESIIADLSARTARLLADPVFTVHGADCGVTPDFGRPDGPFAVLEGSSSSTVVRFDDDLTDTSSLEHREALRELRQCWAQFAIPVRMQAGEHLVVATSRTISARTALHPTLCRTAICVPASASRYSGR